MRCDTPFMKRVDGRLKVLELPCGKCPPCKKRRVNDWTFRLMQEDKRSTSSYFVTLTYDNDSIPRTPNGFLTLKKDDVQKWLKRLRKVNKSKIRYYCVGEYGGQRMRPHYHLIMFNVDDIENIASCWNKGLVHIGQVTTDSVGYTCKYIDKAQQIPKHPNDDRLREYSTMSNNLGDNYLTPEVVKWHRQDLSRTYVVTEGGYKYAMPRYYKERIYTKDERIQQVSLALAAQATMEDRLKYKVQQRYNGQMTFDEYLDQQRDIRWYRFNKNQKPRKNG